MNYVLAQNLSKYYADKLLFDGIDLSINKGQKVALVAKNGTGKTSLLNILAGLEPQDGGTFTIHKDVKIGYLKQSPDFRPADTIIDTVFYTQNEDIQLIKDYELEEIKKKPDTVKLQQLMTEIDTKQLWDLESKVKQILGKLQLHQLDQKMNTLSGGQIKRVALARQLIHEPNFLILDEPTNHLDIEMIEWLERYIQKNTDAVFLVTHDRYFLDNVCDEILELDEGTIFKYKGNYSYYLQKKEERLQNNVATVERAQSAMVKELEWMRRSPQGRGTKAKSRISSFYDLKDKANKNYDEGEVKMDLTMNRLGKKVMEIQDITKAYDDRTLIKNFTYIFNRYDRIGISGANGCGKSTLLNIIVGNVKADSGKIVTGATVTFGYFRQDLGELDESLKVIQVIQDIAEVIRLSSGKDRTAAQMLEWFQFDRKKQHQYVNTLSGGEKRRLYLLTVLMKNPNFLILDEPTNDLDLQTLNTLEEFLEDFGGVLVMVSHDRYFMDKLIDHLFVLDGKGAVRDFPGNYSQYRLTADKEKQAEKREKAAEVKTTQKTDRSKTKLSYNEKREFEQLERDLADLEKRKAEIETEMTANQNDHQKIMDLSSEMGNTLNAIDEKELRWLELSEFM